MALVNYDNSDNEISDVDSIEETTNEDAVALDKVEPEYKMRVPKSAARTAPPSSTTLPNLVASKTKTGKVLLTVPALEELDSSSDESDNEQGSAKNQRTKKTLMGGQPAVGLLSLLPPTRAPVGRDGQKPTLMIPHQLAVKRPAPGHLVKTSELGEAVNQSKSQNNAPEKDAVSEVAEEDDTEEDSSAFFSFFEPVPESQQAVAEVRVATANRILQAMHSKADEPQLGSTQQPELEEPPIVSASYNKPPPRPSVQTYPLSRIDPTVLSELEVPKKDASLDGDEDMEDAQYWTEQTFVPGPERKRARMIHPGTRSIPVHDLLATSNQLIREVNQADLTAGADLELMKSVTADESQYRSQRASQDDDPGKLAHRKHQITWLAHQAQENELDLEKRWAEARRNKASNRSKYGF